jgi:hypothetical protein
MREFGFLVRVCTPREATNFGIFLNEVFALVERWRSAEVFKRECATANTFKVMSDRGGRARAAPAASSKGGAPPAKGEEGGAAGAADAGQQAGTDQAEQRAAEGEVKAAEEPAAAASPAAAARPPSGPRNVDHREWLNLCFNWQKVGRMLEIELWKVVSPTCHVPAPLALPLFVLNQPAAFHRYP